MIQYLLAVAGGYLIGSATKDKQFAKGGGIGGRKGKYSLDYLKMKQEELDEAGNTLVAYDENKKEWYWEDYKNEIYRTKFKTEISAYDNLIDYLESIQEETDYRMYAKGGEVKNLNLNGVARMRELENILKDKINENNRRQIKAKIITDYDDAKKRDTIERFALSGGGMSVLRMMKGKKRFGQLLSYVVPDIDRVVGVQFYDETEKSYADELETRQKYILKNMHPNLWSDIRQEFSFSADTLDSFRTATEGMSHYESWNLAPEYGLPRIEGHRTITMESAGMPKYAQEDLKKAIEDRRNYRYAWDCGYDCSVETKLSEDGKYRAWFSQEFRGTGNGHYWILISPTQAIFSERD